MNTFFFTLFQPHFHWSRALSTMVFIHKDCFDSMPKVTFYITTVFELRGETDKYTYSIE
jgi:hypothetical protein